ncbi:Momilactone A synthase [Citrus sinensis]|uniref:Momilactone A synthase n=1 Tax=Citrus sinensis TaxID=2711 RepID=A0ACB8IRJ0_CITSI|nr:Momilactone A synthase [Citrus sinensis]
MLQLWHGNSMLHRLLGKVALITGGASGFGECTARLFSRHGAKVLIADIKDDLGESVCKDIGSSSSSANGCSYVHCDVTKEKEIENAVNTAVSQYGKLDIMFNNAGIVDEAKHNILDNDQAEFERVLSVNLVGVFLGTKHAARVMKPAGRGSIISTASVCGVNGGVASHAYTSSKHGVDFYKLDDDGLSAIYSNLSGAVLKPEDVAEAALYLGSDESKCVSGHNLVVDGGFTIVNEGLCMFGKSE